MKRIETDGRAERLRSITKTLKFTFILLLLHTTVVFCSAQSKWTTHGPFGGCCFQFAYNPSEPRLVIGVGGKDIFRSTDAGIHWKATRLSDSYNIAVRI